MEERELRIALRTIVENLLKTDHPLPLPARTEVEQTTHKEDPAMEPWIQTDLCTSCGECLAINSSLFGYNPLKKAIIKNPRGGPFRDLVRAAEKCSAGIIHPGSPLDPREKDLERWIKRARRYNS